MIEFDLVLAIQGAELCTREGEPARLIRTDDNKLFPLIVDVDIFGVYSNVHKTILRRFDLNGRIVGYKKFKTDLMIKEK